MGRKRSNKNKHRKRRIHVQAMERLIHDDEKFAKHKAFLEKVEQDEVNFLNRTIFVTNAKDLRLQANIESLKTFFQSRYGDVEKCCISSYQGKQKANSKKPPPATITFKTSSTAAKLFGRPLDVMRRQTNRQQSKTLIRAEGVAYHRGYCPNDLIIYPAEQKTSNRIPLQDHVDDVLSNIIAARSISLGHWVPEDNGLHYLKEVDVKNFTNEKQEFLEEFSGFHGAEVRLDLRRRLLQIKLKVVKQILLDTEYFQTILVRFKDLQRAIHLGYDEDDASFSLLFSCKHPPKLTEITITPNLYESSERLTSIQDAPFGRCLGYKICCSKSEFDNLFRQREKFSKRMNDFGIVMADSCDDAIFYKTRQIEYGSDEKELFESSADKFVDRKTALLARSVLGIGRVCSWYDALYDNVKNDAGQELNFFELIQSKTYGETHSALQLMKEMDGATRLPSKVLNSLLLDSWPQPTKHPPHSIELPRFILTPTKLFFAGFDVEMSNRVVREFVKQDVTPEDFLRLSFSDENNDRLMNDDFKSPQIAKRIKTTMLKGFMFNNCKYKFLAYSSSQLKEGSIWMVNCSQEPHMVEKIRQFMGDFSNIKNPSKVAARMGQCFSTTIEASYYDDASYANRTINEKTHLDVVNDITRSHASGGGRNHQWLTIDDTMPDVYSTTNAGRKSCHSDGTGIIRRDILTRILKKVPSVNDPEDISIIQIRIGGAKGTLTAWDNLPRLQTKDVCIRPSMVKFPVPYGNIEIVKVGKHVPYYLNRQMIMLLSVHDVPSSTFLEMQASMLNDLDEMLIEKHTAHDNVLCLSGLESHTRSLLLKMLECGFTPLREPFLFSCLYALRAQQLMNLKKKSRIFVKEGAVLIGGMDESGEIPKGCIFVQAGGAAGKFSVITGPILISKHPVIHPGDVRMLLGIDVPSLRRHKNVVLFSKHGDRSETDKMSGSDLDGDEFALCWDRRLFLNEWNNCKSISSGNFQSAINGRVLTATRTNLTDLNNANHPPMAFDTQQKATNVPIVLDEHLVSHFINFGASDSLGRISMLWLDHASRKKAADCEECIKLAELHSVAVDYPKSGVSAVIPKTLLIYSSDSRPHWRERKNCEAYHCNSSIGKLYDAIVSRVDSKLFKDSPAVASRSFNKRGQLLCFMKHTKKDSRGGHNLYRTDIAEVLGLFPLKEDCVLESELLSFAFEQRYHYEDSLITLMNKYKIHSEGELITGCIIKFHKLNKRRQYDVALEVRRQSNNLFTSYRELFIRKVLSMVCTLDSISEIELEHYMQWGEICATTNNINLYKEINRVKNNATQDGVIIDMVDGKELTFRHLAWKLAASYYVVTFHPILKVHGEDDHEYNIDPLLQALAQGTIEEKNIQRDADGTHVLYSFPRVIYDIISIAIDQFQKK